MTKAFDIIQGPIITEKTMALKENFNKYTFKVAKSANKVRKEPLRVILNGLGKDAAQIISRVNGFTYVKTKYNFQTQELEILDTRKFSNTYKIRIC